MDAGRGRVEVIAGCLGEFWGRIWKRLEVCEGVCCWRRKMVFFRGGGREILGSHALSGFSQLAKGGGGRGGTWFYQRLEWVVDSNSTERGKIGAEGCDRQGDARLMPPKRRMGKLREGVRVEGSVG